METLTKFFVALALALAVSTPWSANAQISVELADKCRELMVKAYPDYIGSAAKQRDYFAECIKRQGNVPEASQTDKGRQPSTTGKGN